MIRRAIAAAAILGLLAGACQGTGVPSSQSTTSSPILTVSSAPPEAAVSDMPVAGGCGSTQVFAGPGPDAAMGLADNPWATATPASAEIVAYFWLPPPDLVYAHEPHGGTKVLWVSHGEQAERMNIVARPHDALAPVIRFDFPPTISPGGNYPSIIDLPTPGCWHLEITLGPAQGTMDLLVAPAR